MVVFKDGEPIIVPDDYLAHHGVLGMKWGIRRYQNKDGTLTSAGKKRLKVKEYRSELNDFKRKYREEDSRTAELNRIEKQAYALAKKYDFDGDDGGGGSTKKAQEAGKKYMELWDQYTDLEDLIDRDVSKKAASAMVDKYGKDTIDSVQSRAQQENVLKATAFVTALWAVPITIAALKLR